MAFDLHLDGRGPSDEPEVIIVRWIFDSEAIDCDGRGVLSKGGEHLFYRTRSRIHGTIVPARPELQLSALADISAVTLADPALLVRLLGHRLTQPLARLVVLRQLLPDFVLDLS